jgi:hypothetical protein
VTPEKISERTLKKSVEARHNALSQNSGDKGLARKTTDSTDGKLPHPCASVKPKTPMAQRGQSVATGPDELQVTRAGRTQLMIVGISHADKKGADFSAPSLLLNETSRA